MHRPTTICPFFGGNLFPSAAQKAASVAAFAFSNDASDPYNLYQRFILTQEQEFRRALSEIRSGRKQSHWSWFCIPAPSLIRNGVEVGSLINRQYALRDKPPRDHEGFECCAAYLKFTQRRGISLRDNYFLLMDAARQNFESGAVCSGEELWGIDHPRFLASVRLFEKSSRNGVDPEINELTRNLMKLFGQNPDP